MNSILILVIVFLLICLYVSRTKRTRDIRAIATSLNEMLASNTPQKLFFATNDSTLQYLLVAINRMLKAHQHESISYVQKELAMKRMLTNISHDLRTPLTIVLGLIETILHNPNMTVHEKEQLLLKIHSRAQEIVLLINRFFELVQLESEDLELPLAKINVTELCRRNILLFYHDMESKGLEADLQLSERPVYTLGNEEAFNRILQNLLSNAIRYGSDGSVIGMALREEGPFVNVEVWDRGRGISKLEQELVFERLYRTENDLPHMRSEKGTGLGLSISKRLVEKMGGCIRLESQPFEKTIVTVQLKRI